ncbi:MAG TPA: PEP-CTERM sorting domain-containing protein [Terriglobales bacterium]
MRYVKLTILLCGLVWLCCSSNLFASQVVSSGSICCLEPATLYTFATFQLSGAGFSVTGEFDDPTGTSSFGGCGSCPPGTLLPISGSTGGENFGVGTATIGTTSYPFVSWFLPGNNPLGSVISISGPPILMSGPGIFRGTFSFIGELCGVDSLNDTSCTVSLPNLTGSGIVTVELAPIVGSPNLYVSEEYYTFTPEPASWLLLGSGALGLAGVLRRKLML